MMIIVGTSMSAAPIPLSHEHVLNVQIQRVLLTMYATGLKQCNVRDNC